jgi:hypothetical protein
MWGWHGKLKMRVIDLRGMYERTIFAGKLDDHANHAITYEQGGKPKGVTVFFHSHKLQINADDFLALQAAFIEGYFRTKKR